MKLYVVDRDDSGLGTVDYGIAGIFSTKEKASDFIRKARKADHVNEKYCYEITETNLDSPGEEMFDLSVYMSE